MRSRCLSFRRPYRNPHHNILNSFIPNSVERCTEALKPRNIFRLLLSHVAVSSKASEALQFFQWDLIIGFLFLLIPAAAKYKSSLTKTGKNENAVILALRLLVAVALVGPGATFVGIKWMDDEIVLTQEESGSVSKIK